MRVRITREDYERAMTAVEESGEDRSRNCVLALALQRADPEHRTWQVTPDGWALRWPAAWDGEQERHRLTELAEQVVDGFDSDTCADGPPDELENGVWEFDALQEPDLRPIAPPTPLSARPKG
jgi:hypothetical protein